MLSNLKFMNELDYESITSNLATKEVVLFLGPLFGIDSDNEKMNSRFREKLKKLFDLDDEFENLFILKQSKEKIDAGDLLNLRNQFGRFYESQEAHKVYSTIAQLKFTAVINCSQDLFLNKAFEDSHTKCAFFHFSAKKADLVKQTQKSSKPDEDNPSKGAADNQPELPIVYNVYGSYKDPQSLITDYETFYNFLISLIGANDEIPQELKTALKKADIFIFLGFNLTKWYIPLLIRKLYKLADNEKVSSYATLEDTLNELNFQVNQQTGKTVLGEINKVIEKKESDEPVKTIEETETDEAVRTIEPETIVEAIKAMDNETIVEAINAMDKDTSERVSGFLDRYPARFRVTNETNVEFIDRIAKGEGVLRPVSDPKHLQQSMQELDLARTALLDTHSLGDNMKTLKELKDYFKKSADKEREAKVVGLEARLNQVNRDFDDQRITLETKRMEMASINRLTTELINSISI